MIASCNNETNETAVRMINDQCTIRLSDQTVLREKNERILPIYIEFEDLCYSVCQSKGNRKQILQDIAGCFRPGKLTLIIGPSGAGKTSLLSIIAGLKSANVMGTIAVNAAGENRTTFRKHMCYIPQEFALQPLLTTRETLYIAARLKLDQRKSNTSSIVATEIAEGLGLTNCLDTLVGNLSGGEKKRLSIGVDIVTKPSVMLLDEPTSGLDSAASNQVINLVHSMAQSGCTVACTVHQPSSQMISQFDDIIVLSEGRCFYCGPREEILSTFSNAGFICPQFYNIAEFVLEVVTKQRGDDLENLYSISLEKYIKWKAQLDYSRERTGQMDMPQEYIESKEERAQQSQKLTCWQQQKVLFLRSMICVRRDNTMTKLRLAAHVLVALLLGAVFYNFGDDGKKASSNIACIFFFLLFLFFANSMPAVQMFPTEAAVFLREHANNWYHLRSYYVVKVVSDLPLQILCPTTFLMIAYYLTDQPLEWIRIWETWAVCILLTILGQSVGIVTGAAFNVEIGTFLIPALSIPLFLFAGFFLKLGEIPVYLQPFSTISFFRFAFEGVMQAIYGYDRAKLKCSEIYCFFRTPKEVLSMMDMPSVGFHTIIIVLTVWILCLHLIIYVTLRWKSRNMRK